MKDELTVRVHEYIYCDDVVVLVPPMFYMHPSLGECIKKAILATQESDGKKES